MTSADHKHVWRIGRISRGPDLNIVSEFPFGYVGCTCGALHRYEAWPDQELVGKPIPPEEAEKIKVIS